MAKRKANSDPVTTADPEPQAKRLRRSCTTKIAQSYVEPDSEPEDDDDDVQMSDGGSFDEDEHEEDDMDEYAAMEVESSVSKGKVDKGSDAKDTKDTKVPVRLFHPERMLLLQDGSASKARYLKKPTVKKSKGSRKNLGGLDGLMDLPVEVFCEIAKLMHPLDLLYLSRVSKAMRSLLLSRGSKSIWCSVLDEFRVPPIPANDKDFSEPQLVALLFERTCQACGAGNVKKINYAQRLRLCKGCQTYNFANASTILREHCPRLPKTKGRIVSQMLPSRGRKHVIVDFVDAAERYLQFRPKSNELQLFLSDHLKLRTFILNHAYLLNRWEKTTWYEKCNDGRRKVNERKECIKAKALELGYTSDEVKKVQTLHPHVWESIALQPRPMTGRIWTTVLPRLQTIMEETRKELRMKKKREALLDSFKIFYQNWISEHERPIFTFHDLLELPSVDVLLNDVELLTISDEQWQDIQLQLPACIESMETRVRGECAKVFQEIQEAALEQWDSSGIKSISKNTETPVTEDVLDMAASAYTSSPFSIARTYNMLFQRNRAPSYDVWYERAQIPIQTKASVDAVVEIFDMLHSLGLPTNVTLAHMDSLSSSLRCRPFNSPCVLNTSNKFTKWYEVLHHACHHRKYRQDCKIVIE